MYQSKSNLFVLIFLLLGVKVFAQLPDSTQRDTVKKVVKPNAKWVLPNRAYYHDSPNVAIVRDFRKQMYWDEVDTLKGFVNSLGVVGKPYRHSIDGFADRHFVLTQWKNPVLGTYSTYLLNSLTDVKYFDTKTPYVNIDFCQGPQRSNTKDITISAVTAAVNLTPFWNVAAYIKRRQAQSIYGEATTDTRNIYLSSYFHTWKNKYQLFTNFTYNDQNNGLNGGVYFTPEANFSSAFQTGVYTNLTDVTQKVMTKAWTADQYYTLFSSKDSSKIRQQLTIRNTLLYENMYQKSVLPSLDVNLLTTNIVPIVPTLTPDSTSIDESFETHKYSAFGGVSYRFATSIFTLNVDGGLGYQYLSFSNPKNKLGQNTFEQKANAHLDIPKLRLAYQFRFFTTPNNLFGAELYTQHQANWLLPIPYLSLKKDSLRSSKYVQVASQPNQKPFRLRAEYFIYSQNPTIYQKYYVPVEGNSFQANAALKNQQTNHLHAEISYQSRSLAFKKDTLLPNSAYLRPFITTGSNMLYYGTKMEVLQAPQGQTLTWLGAEIGANWRMFRRWYLAPKVVYQKGFTATDADAYLQKYADHLPSIYTHAAFFHESKNPAFKGRWKYGGEVYFHSWFRAHSLDVVSTEFFPTDYFTKGYIRIDLFFSMQIKRANVFAKLTNVGDKLILPGYFLTGTYPALGRTLNLGINWSFFD
ncbi:MAG: putative porin [Bacteroidia bacterium]